MEFSIDPYKQHKSNPSKPDIKLKVDLQKVGLTNKKMIVEEGKGRNKKIIEQYDIVEAAEQFNDKTPHVKFFGSMDYLCKLNPSALKVFVHIVQNLGFQEDKVLMSPNSVAEKLNIDPSTARRAINDLVKAEIIFNSTLANIYWLNIGRMYRGNRRFLVTKEQQEL